MAGRVAPSVVGVDLGGSKILTAVVDSRGGLIASDRRATQASRGADTVIRNLLASVHASIEKSGVPEKKIAAIGLGAPGISNPETGIVYRSPNLPGWLGVPIRDIVRERIGKETFLINDANAAAVGEMHYGAARGARNFVYVTVSTGIGGGIIIDGELYTGAAGMAGEVGHIVVEPHGLPCNCGGSGCWEMYASGSAIARRAREAIESGAGTKLLAMAGGDAARIDAPLIQKAALAGDVLAACLIEETARYLAIGFGSLINVFNPELIVVGGGMTGMGDMLLAPAFKDAGHWSYADAYRVTRFAVAELGESSGVVGAAVHARERLKAMGEN